MKLLLLVAAIHLLIVHQYYKNKRTNAELERKIAQKTKLIADKLLRNDRLPRAFNDTLTSGKTEQNDFLYALYFYP